MTGDEIRTPPYFAVFRGREEIARCLTPSETHAATIRAAEANLGVRIISKRVTKSGRRFYGSVMFKESSQIAAVGDDEAAANARLIAAAPELYSALEAMLDRYGRDSNSDIKRAGDALAKARGELQ